MLSRGSKMLDTLPFDILYRIIHFMPILDMVRLQQVSRFFCELLGARTIWSETYRTTLLPHYPGPFPHQSASFLKQDLVSSAKVAQNWAPNVPVPTEQRTFQSNEPYDNRRILMTRWLICLHNSRQINYIDMDSANGEVTPSILYSCDSEKEITDHHYVWTMSPEGHIQAFAVVLEMSCDDDGPHPDDSALKLFKVSGHDGPTLSLELVQSYPIISSRQVGFVLCFIGPRLLAINIVASDVDTQSFYIDLKTFGCYEISIPPIDMIHTRSFISCSTHLLVIRTPLQYGRDLGYIVLDAFVIPPAPADGTDIRSELELSYHGTHPASVSCISVLHDPGLNPSRLNPYILLLVKAVGKSNSKPFIGAMQIDILQDNSVAVRDIRKICPLPQSPSFLFSSVLGGSARVLQSRFTRNGIELDAHSFILFLRRDGFDIRHRCTGNVLTGIHEDKDLLSFNGMRGRLLLSEKKDRNLYSYTVLDFD
ncbi:hypothetical protein BJ138DRAFT_1156126 [Hygrophoropsis aurantiaca]|uniref:Uncharacterized protein n=1 Tax=Hygrophoropsis aurantiaca TaxID=72124 RepID=A0ACB8A6D3_9AGAM|nr:hypothetical protein BJ138DRAFT_1156126 [Hygrophoropsis aurantiaca]